MKADRDNKSKIMDAMWVHIQAMENHNKLNNLRLVGLKETFRVNGTLLYPKNLLRESGVPGKLARWM